MDEVKKPSLLNVILEGRAVFEIGAFYATYPIFKSAPKGDGHPVIVIPGFLANDFSTRPLRVFLKDMNYYTYGWRLGVNYIRMSYVLKLQAFINSLYEKHQAKVSLIGWSAGGAYARILGNLMPDKVRQVITLGTPFATLAGESNVDFIRELVAERKKGDIPAEMSELMMKAPPMPFTSIYSKGDGIVSWQYCLEKTQREDIQNIEVFGSHYGLVVAPPVLYCIADRLAQSEEDWKLFEPSIGWKKLFYPDFWKNSIRIAG